MQTESPTSASGPLKPHAATPTNILGYEARNPLDAIFAPRNIAVIGATEKAGSVGRAILENLVSNTFAGTVFPVNSKRPDVLGLPAYPTIGAVPELVDLAVIVTPAPTVPGVIAECAKAGVRGAIIISAGFKEAGPQGAELERQVFETAREANIRIIGPNCLGIMRPFNGLNATFANAMAQPGNVAFISQSGALCTAVLDWSLRENVGFSAFVSIGSMVDVGWGDLIDYLGNDPRTKSIVIYMETIGDARSFLSAAREVALNKPIIVIKAGRTGAAAQAAASHTGSLTGSNEVFEAALRRSGVLRVNSIAELFYMAEVLSKQPRPAGSRLTILTNAGGPGVLATDALIAGGGELAPISDELSAKLSEFLPAHWSHHNPIDILGDADPPRYARALETAAHDRASDGLLVIVTPQAMTNPTQTAEQLKGFAQGLGKPVLASWMGGAEMAAGETILNQAGIPTFPYPDTAAQVFNYMWQYSYNLDTLYQTPQLAPDSDQNGPDRAGATAQLESLRKAGRTLLTELEAKQLLDFYRIPTVPTRLATSGDQAALVAAEIGFPVVLKLNSNSLTHKTDVGGVRLNLADAAAVQEAFEAIRQDVTRLAGAEHFQGVTVQPMIRLEGYELIIGSSLDPQFGPVLLFGSGGELVEVYKDNSLALPPLNTNLARRLMERTRIMTALKGVRGRPPVDLAALEQLLVRFSQLVVEQRWIKEIDINPLTASPAGLLALDARVVLHEPGVREQDLPKLAIQPYPIQYIGSWTTKDGQVVTIRPIRPEDEPLMVSFHETLSDRSVYFRWFHGLKLSQRVAHERLRRICFIDYDREMALVADRRDPQTGQHELMGVGRLMKLHGSNRAEFAITISDAHQRQGLGTELLRRLVEVGRDMRLEAIIGYVLPENLDMVHVSKKLGFKVRHNFEDGLIEAVLVLEGNV